MFPQLKGHVYLDHAGTPPCPASLVQKYTEFLTQNLLGNAHSAGSLSANETFTQIQSVRQRILNHFEAQNYYLIFTSGATEAIRLIGEMFKGPFYYLFDSHTSIVGLTQLMPSSNCLSFEEMENLKPSAGSLIAFPAQSNFNGRRFPFKDWTLRLEPDSHVLLDAASFVSTHPLQLSKYEPSFVVLSFYKMFGFPTGLGALFIKKSVVNKLNPVYFGGGNVNAVGIDQTNVYFQWRHGIEQRLERGTVAFQQIVALKFGFEFIEQEMGGWKALEDRTMKYTQQTRQAMKQLSHDNGAPMVLLYDSLEDEYGPIIAFQLLFPNGSFVGYSEVMTLATLHQIHLRTGCFCNPGACQHYLGLSLDNVKHHSEVHGHVCWDGKDLIDGKPTGAVRISFGMASTEQDVHQWLSFLKGYFTPISMDYSLPVEKDYRLISMTLFPIKSCGGMKVNEWPVSQTGLLYDRCLALMDSNGRMLTQKRYPKMGCITISQWNLDSHGLTITLNAPEQDDISFLIPSVSEQAPALNVSAPGCKSCTTSYPLEHLLIHQWFSDFLKIECHLLSTHQNGNFSNESSFLLVNQSSYDNLASQIPNSTDISIDHFRANFVIEAPCWIEDDWVGQTLKIGTGIFKASSHCQRCQMICIQTKTGKRLTEPLNTLSKYHRIQVN